jgi:predicted dehydrogenase
MSERIRIGIIGTSGYAKLLLSALATYDDAELAAICGRTRSRADELAGEYQIAQVFTDYNDMFKHGRLDGVIIASPDDLHYSMTMAALAAGLHVLCEKPMASTVDQARQMLEAAKQAGVKHMIEFSWRWMPHYQYLHKLVSDGYMGQGYHHQYRFLGNRGRINDYTWRFDPRCSIGVLGDLGSHMVDLALWISGDITSVSAHLASFSTRTDPEGHSFAGANESALLAVEFADGAQGMIHVSTVAHTAARGREQYVTLHGADGSLEVEWRVFGGAEKGVIVRGCRHDAEDFRVLEIPSDYLQGVEAGEVYGLFTKQLVGPRLFVDAILHDYMPTPGFEQGFKVQQVLEAAMVSDQTGQRVQIDA